MQFVRILMALFSLMAALTLVGLGAAGASATVVEAAPCHERVASDPTVHHSTTDTETPGPPTKGMKVMACCIACVAATPAVPDATPASFGRPGVQPALQPIRHGLIPAPEPEPPKA